MTKKNNDPGSFTKPPRAPIAKLSAFLVGRFPDYDPHTEHSDEIIQRGYAALAEYRAEQLTNNVIEHYLNRGIRCGKFRCLNKPLPPADAKKERQRIRQRERRARLAALNQKQVIKPELRKRYHPASANIIIAESHDIERMRRQSFRPIAKFVIDVTAAHIKDGDWNEEAILLAASHVQPQKILLRVGGTIIDTFDATWGPTPNLQFKVHRVVNTVA